MEKEFFSNAATQAPPGWSSINQHELNCSSEQLTSYFFNPNWDGSMDQNNDPFESALSSMVSSPSVAASALNASNESVVLRELIGRLGGICNSTDISPHHSYKNINNNSNNNNNCNSTNTSCYSTPLNSPPKLNLSMMDQQMSGNLPIPGSHRTLAPFSADPGFAERAARLSCFGSRSFNSRTNNGQYGLNNESEKQIPRVSSCHSLKVPGPQMVVVQDGIQLPDKKYNGYSRSNTPENADSREESSVSEQIPAGESGLKGPNGSSTKKRKSIPRGKAKEIQSANHAKDLKDEDSNKKRSKSDEEANGNDKAEEMNAGEGNQKQSKDNSKPPEPPKDYIHVRARRGQATDSHSLAERVRREKISERMKFLQDLVPGCNKVTGKAVMLDEIINYVQSLQRQVEFLSMKLATVNPSMDVNMDALLSKDILPSRGTLTQNMYPLESSAAFPYAYQSQAAPLQNVLANGSEAPYSMSPLSSALRRGQGMQMPSIDAFIEASSQMSMWDDELHSMVQMGLPQSQPRNFQGSMAASQMKLEL